MQEAKVPFLAANIIGSATKKPIAQPYALRDVAALIALDHDRIAADAAISRQLKRPFNATGKHSTKASVRLPNRLFAPRH